MILIKLILITTSWCLIVKTLTHEGMILEKLGRYAEEQVRNGKKYFEPLIHCEWCLSSLHTAIGFMIGFGLEVLPFKWSWKLLIMYLVVSISTSFISGCLWNLAMTLLEYGKQTIKNS